MAPIQIANSTAAKATAGTTWPLRQCHHIAADAATNAPDAYPEMRSGPMSWVMNMAAINTPATKNIGQAYLPNDPPADPDCASRSVIGPARRKKNHAAPTINQTRPSSEVS